MTSAQHRHVSKQRSGRSAYRFSHHAAILIMCAATLAAAGCGTAAHSASTSPVDSSAASTPTAAQAGLLIWGGAYSSHIGISALAEPPVTSILQTPGLGAIDGLAVGGGYVYAAENTVPVHIGRAVVDSTGPHPTLASPQPQFITVGSPQSRAEGIAVGGAYVYWTTESTIGRARLDGTQVEPEFIKNLASQSAQGIAVEGEYIYWDGGGAIARARLDGAELNPAYISGLEQSNPADLAADTEHLYWSSRESIGRVSLSGASVEPRFLIASQPSGIAVDSAHIFWGGYNAPIGRAALDGKGAEPSWIDTQRAAEGVQSLALTKR
jgi:hypothetical protein